MKTKKILLAALAGTALLAATGAQAHDDRWGYGRHGNYYRHVPQRVVVVRPAPYYYYARPAPVYYVPPAPVYYQPRPVLYGQVPVNPNLHIGFRIGL